MRFDKHVLLRGAAGGFRRDVEGDAARSAREFPVGGLVIWMKRLEGGTFQRPRGEPGVDHVELDATDLAGIELASVKRRPRYRFAPARPAPASVPQARVAKPVRAQLHVILPNGSIAQTVNFAFIT